MALEGFVALAPDLLSPLGGTPADEDKARDMFDQARARRRRSPMAWRRSPSSRHDGGQWQGRRRRLLLGRRHGQRSGRQRARPRRAVAYYGRQPKAEDVAKIKAPLLLHYAGLDERIDAGIDAYKAALDARPARSTRSTSMTASNHAFNNDTSAARYDKAAAELAWGRTIAFFKEKL